MTVAAPPMSRRVLNCLNTKIADSNPVEGLNLGLYPRFSALSSAGKYLAVGMSAVKDSYQISK
jgi:hypothetical protein